MAYARRISLTGWKAVVPFKSKSVALRFSADYSNKTVLSVVRRAALFPRRYCTFWMHVLILPSSPGRMTKRENFHQWRIDGPLMLRRSDFVRVTGPEQPEDCFEQKACLQSPSDYYRLLRSFSSLSLSLSPSPSLSLLSFSFRPAKSESSRYASPRPSRNINKSFSRRMPIRVITDTQQIR
jgi:hypothetical protein